MALRVRPLLSPSPFAAATQANPCGSSCCRLGKKRAMLGVSQNNLAAALIFLPVTAL